ncbi:glycine-rich RNA-binding protein blt801-like isoform X2 [Simochromis diagramma]|uniref:glycine-rich RNA-binding protein blt801-like isoform X2 n=1 Tax=Simochromis diagramma TaxID=43689 RepID=UPI001A7E5A0C|nr:glycine-rich RNA-binding protein blt801-like isoform X2 [Simochromis diagramma]
MYKTEASASTDTLQTAAVMADFLGKALGNDGIARTAGQQAGKVVEGVVKKALGGNKQQEGEQKKEGGGGGGFGVGDVLKLAGGNKNEAQGGGGGGFGVGDVLKLAGGNKNEDQGGAGGGMGNALGGLFK